MSNVDVEQLSRLNHQYIAAIAGRDANWFAEHLSEDFLNSNPDGSLADKAQFIAGLSKSGAVSNLAYDDVRIRLIGADTAIIHARTNYLKPDGQPGAGRYTDIWVRGGGRWRCVAAHVTRG